MKSILILLFIVVTAFAPIPAMAMGAKPGQGIPEIGMAAPNIVLGDLSGRQEKLSSYKGRVVFLNFFATWCPPCREEMPSMQSLFETLATDRFEMIAIALDKEGARKVSPFVEEKGLKFKVLLDSDNKVALAWGIRGIPTTYIIGKNGIILEKVVGGMDWNAPSIIERLNGYME